MLGEGGFEGGGEVFEGEGFFEEAVDADACGFSFEARGGEAGHQQDAEFRRFASQGLAHLNPVHLASQHPVREKNIRRKGPGDFDRFRAGLRGTDFKATPAQEAAKVLSIGRLIVDDQDTNQGVAGKWGSRTRSAASLGLSGDLGCEFHSA